jgi:hypothetical protein
MCDYGDIASKLVLWSCINIDRDLKKDLDIAAHLTDAIRYITINHTINATMNINPDGSQRADKPRDGETYHVWDTQSNDVKTWKYDGYHDQWFVTDDLLHEFERLILESDEVPAKCECGSEKVGSSNHSNYCPKYSQKS